MTRPCRSLGLRTRWLRGSHSAGLVCCLAAWVMPSAASAGALFPGPKFAAGDQPVSVAVADLDGDSVPDLVTANQGSHDVSVLLGNGDGTFQTAAAFAAGNSPRSVAVADLDGDTVLDLVTANAFSDDVSVLLGNGDGSFQAAVAYAAGDGPASVAVADLDGDSVPDLVTANGNSHDVTVFLPEPDVRLLLLAGVGLLALLARRRSTRRAR